MTRKETKKATSKTRARVFDGLYQPLGTKEGEGSIYRLNKGRERKMRNLSQVKCIKDEEGKALVTKQNITER